MLCILGRPALGRPQDHLVLDQLIQLGRKLENKTIREKANRIDTKNLIMCGRLCPSLALRRKILKTETVVVIH